MRIITLEEHTLDPGIAKATQAAQAAEAGYLPDLAGTAEDATPPSGNRPRLLLVREIMPRAADVGAGRLADMDAHGIDMQVLSYSSAPQLAPAGQGVELARAANDRLAEAVRAHPGRVGGGAPHPRPAPPAAASPASQPCPGRTRRLRPANWNGPCTSLASRARCSSGVPARPSWTTRATSQCWRSWPS